MKPRVLYRTHYQVDEPAYMELLVKLCTSPVQATYTERVAQRLVQEVSSRGRKFNVAAAGYAIDLAHALGVVNENNTWTDKGHLVALHCKIKNQGIEAEMELDAAERLTHFRLFLEADGAAMHHIAGVSLRDRKIPADHDWNRFSGEMFRDIYGAYLVTTSDITERLVLRRELERLKETFSGKTGAHKSFIHLQTMTRLGLLHRPEPASQRVYELPVSSGDGLAALLRLIPTVSALEEIVDKGRWSEVAAAVLCVGRGPTISDQELLRVIAQLYRHVSETGVPLCSLDTLVDAVQIHLMTSGFRLLTSGEIIETLMALQRPHPGGVRFHVGRRGRVAFVKISRDLVISL